MFAVCASHPPALGLILGVSKSFNSNLDVSEINRLHLEFGQVGYVSGTHRTYVYYKKVYYFKNVLH